jgi:CRP-like cAMP-binding protein
VLKAEPGEVAKLINQLGRGSYFGEIGPLKNIKRTATVQAGTQPVEVMAIDWPTFSYLIAHLDLTSPEIAALLMDKFGAVVPV